MSLKQFYNKHPKLILSLVGIVIVIATVFFFMKENFTDIDYTPAIDNLPVPQDKEAQDFIDTIDEIDLSEDLLIPGNNFGINTVQTSKKNPNLQLRTDPAVPVIETGPWNQSTIVTHIQKKSLGE